MGHGQRDREAGALESVLPRPTELVLQKSSRYSDRCPRRLAATFPFSCRHNPLPQQEEPADAK
jgi:hypothetical protein